MRLVEKFSCAIDIFLDDYFKREAEEGLKIAEELTNTNKL
jgi:hypothetical protein